MFKVDASNENWLKEAKELVKHVGFCVVENALKPEDCVKGIQALKDSYSQVEDLIGLSRLKRAGEEGVIRAPMSFDDYFFGLLENAQIQSISESLVSETSILHLQNGFIFPKHDPEKKLSNFQYTFHPDYPRYHNGYVASMNALVTFEDVKEEDEVFYVVPGTHHSNYKLEESYCLKNKLSISAKAGSILIFDSTLWHCGGPNHSSDNWYGVNHQFTQSFLKQQLDYVRVLGDEKVLEQSPRVQQMLGFYTRVVTSLDEYYQPSEKRLYRSGQG